MIEILNLKLVILLGYQNIKNIFAKGYFPNWSEEVLVIKRIKNNVLCTYVISDFKGNEIAGKFFKKELQKTN